MILSSRDDPLPYPFLSPLPLLRHTPSSPFICLTPSSSSSTYLTSAIIHTPTLWLFPSAIPKYLQMANLHTIKNYPKHHKQLIPYLFPYTSSSITTYPATSSLKRKGCRKSKALWEK